MQDLIEYLAGTKFEFLNYIEVDDDCQVTSLNSFVGFDTLKDDDRPKFPDLEDAATYDVSTKDHVLSLYHKTAATFLHENVELLDRLLASNQVNLTQSQKTKHYALIAAFALAFLHLRIASNEQKKFYKISTTWDAALNKMGKDNIATFGNMAISAIPHALELILLGEAFFFKVNHHFHDKNRSQAKAVALILDQYYGDRDMSKMLEAKDEAFDPRQNGKTRWMSPLVFVGIYQMTKGFHDFWVFPILRTMFFLGFFTEDQRKDKLPKKQNPTATDYKNAEVNSFPVSDYPLVQEKAYEDMIKLWRIVLDEWKKTPGPKLKMIKVKAGNMSSLMRILFYPSTYGILSALRELMDAIVENGFDVFMERPANIPLLKGTEWLLCTRPFEYFQGKNWCPAELKHQTNYSELYRQIQEQEVGITQFMCYFIGKTFMGTLSVMRREIPQLYKDLISHVENMKERRSKLVADYVQTDIRAFDIRKNRLIGNINDLVNQAASSDPQKLTELASEWEEIAKVPVQEGEIEMKKDI